MKLWLPKGFDWKKPDYSPVFIERVRMLKHMRETQGSRDGLMAFYREHPAEFIHDWGMTTDPRNAEIGLPVTVPFLLFERQAEAVEWLHERWKAREDGLVEKSRDMGLSWLSVGFAVWMWLFHPNTVIGFGSRKEEYVDKIGDPKSLFWKARKFVDLLPDDFKPLGYTEKKHAPHMRLINPENGATIIGEAGDNIGRGNRTSIYFKDESAFYERADLIDSALSQTSNCKIDISSANGTGNAFYKKRFSGRIPVLSFHWRDDPRKDDDWYVKQKNALDPVIVAQEIDIDYSASVSDTFISMDSVIAAQGVGVADVEAVGAWIVSIDAAHYGDDESVVTFRRGRLTLPQRTYRKVDGHELAALVEGEINEVLHSLGSQTRLGAIVIELDGPGVSCFDTLKRGVYADQVQGVHTGARVNDGKNYNLRAQMWRKAKEYLEQSPVSLPKDAALRIQLSSARYKYKDSMLLMQSKKEYKGTSGKSPDRADSFVLGFAVNEGALQKKKTTYRERRLGIQGSQQAL